MPQYSINKSNMSKFPKIVLVAYHKQEVPDGIELIVLPEEIHEPAGFNRVLSTQQATAYGFLSRHDKFVNIEACAKIANLLVTRPYINFVYGDTVVTGNDFRQQYYFPSTVFNMDNRNMMMVTPIFMRSNHVRFNEELKHLYFHHMIHTLNTFSLGIHIPECLFETQQHPTNFEPDLKLLYGNRS